MHAHVVGRLGRDVLPDEVGTDRKLAVPAIDEDREPDGTRAAVVDERVHRSADRAAGEQHVVDEDDGLAVDGEADRGLVHDRRVPDAREVVPIQRDVEGAQGCVDAFMRADRVTQARGEVVAARADADDRERRDIVVALDDLVSDAGDGTTDVVRGEQDGARLGHSPLPFPASQDRSLKVVRYGEYMRLAVAVTLGIAVFALAVFAARSAPSSAAGAPATMTPRPFVTADPNDRSRQDAATAHGRLPQDQGSGHGHVVVRGLLLPITGIALPTDPDLLPNAPRAYRAGWHEGIDFAARAGTPVRAVAAGTVIRVDTSFTEWDNASRDAALALALRLGYTPAATLDRLRGRQVWIDHGGGIVSRYCHLGSVADLAVGETVAAGTIVGTVGSSGYPEGGPHLHFEVRIGASYLGDGLSGEALIAAIARAFD